MAYTLCDTNINFTARYCCIACAVVLGACNTASKKPTSYTAAPSLGSAIHSVEDAKDFLSRAGKSNAEIKAILERWEKQFEQ